jgi:hypothetical protein
MTADGSGLPSHSRPLRIGMSNVLKYEVPTLPTPISSSSLDGDPGLAPGGQLIVIDRAPRPAGTAADSTVGRDRTRSITASKNARRAATSAYRGRGSVMEAVRTLSA